MKVLKVFIDVVVVLGVEALELDQDLLLARGGQVEG